MIVNWKRITPYPQEVLVTSNQYTNLPMAGIFNKQRDDTFLFLMLNMDYVPSTSIPTFIAMTVNGSIVLSVADASGYPGWIETNSMSELYLQPLPSGPHQIGLQAAVGYGGSAMFRLQVCSYTVFEVLLPQSL